MEKITFTFVEALDGGDRLYRATVADAKFDFVAQYWDADYQFLGTSADAYTMHAGPKTLGDTSLWFAQDPAWAGFAQATGVDEAAFLRAFEAHLTA